MTKTEHQITGKLGEDIACRYLEGKGFTIKARNYRKKWGEIDIVSLKDGITHFVEVKSVKQDSDVSPEDNLHGTKIEKLLRVFESYALEHNTSLHDEKFNWQFDAVLAEIDSVRREARVRFIDDIVVG